MLPVVHLSGDGANDVNMIQAADIGVGISGQEGMQVCEKQPQEKKPCAAASASRSVASETVLRSAGRHGE